nr:MAG TPA: hypothetical protein [Caudoviricetes sp.]
MTKEYITKNRAKQFVCGHCNEVCSEEPCEPSDCDWMAFIDKEPAADVVPVVHGELTEHIHELLRAEKDGRLVVLPCKVGDELWSFSTYPAARVYGFTVTDISTLNGRTVLNTLGCGTLWERDIGKTVFFTREEAEKALETRKNG